MRPPPPEVGEQLFRNAGATPSRIRPSGSILLYSRPDTPRPSSFELSAVIPPPGIAASRPGSTSWLPAIAVRPSVRPRIRRNDPIHCRSCLWSRRRRSRPFPASPHRRPASRPAPAVPVFRHSSHHCRNRFRSCGSRRWWKRSRLSTPGCSRFHSPAQPRLQPPLQLRQPALGDVAVVGPAQDLLHLLDARVQRFAERQRKAVREHLHRIAQPLARDPHLMQMGVVLQVAGRRPLQLAAPVPAAAAGPGPPGRRYAARSAGGRTAADGLVPGRRRSRRAPPCPAASNSTWAAVRWP